MVSYRTDTEVSDEDTVEVFGVYDEVFGDQPDLPTWRAAVWDFHAARDGFRLVRAHDDGATLVGFAYGYTGQAGQWWTDQARRALAPDVARAWLGGHFEVVSLAVVAGARNRGTGRALLRRLVDELPHDRMLLMTTADPADPARRLYASEGWRVLGAGIGNATVIMGRMPEVAA